MKYFIYLIVVLLTYSCAMQVDPVKKNKGDREGHDMTPPIPAKAIPPAPILAVEQAISSTQIQAGFVLENVASEPFVLSPIAMVFDGNGRMWVAEMTTFMPDAEGNNEELPEGNIAILEDTDGDGRVDKRTVFLDDVILPRTIALVKGGILYADLEQLYFAEVLEGDKLGVREVVDPIYAKGGNVEHKPNGMMYSLDNWYYNAKSDRRYKVLKLESEIPLGAEEIYRNQYWKMVVAGTEYRGQWGISVDDYGRLFHNGNSSPAQGEYLRPNSLATHPMFKKPSANNIGSTRVYPSRINPGVNRAYLPNILVEEGPNKGKLANFTAASGNQIYRGDQFPAEFYGVSFTPEPAGNLVSVRRVIEQQGILEGTELYPESEILTSTDERFRPVNLNTAPDGSLYIVDMYHGIIQHKEFLTTYLREQYESRGLDKNNRSMGRIYRLRWQDRPLGVAPQLNDKSATQLVTYLTHSNGWWRDTARQLLVQLGDQTVVPAIRTLLTDKKVDHLGKISALWALEGLGGLNLASIEAGLTNAHPKVKVSAIELSARLAKVDHPIIAKHLNEMASSDYEVALQIALIAGRINGEMSLQALKKVIHTYPTAPLIKEAAISGLSDRETEFKQVMADSQQTEFLSMLDSVGVKDVMKSNLLQLSQSGQESYQRGKGLYDGKAACFGCHAKNGEGISNMGPPLVNSEWVNSSEERLGKVLLHGLMGPITVNSKDYNGSMIMPGFVASLNDQELADISTYLRNNWGNESSEVRVADFKLLRERTADRKVPYQQQDFVTVK